LILIVPKFNDDSLGNARPEILLREIT
jgi:hypothetical protein